MNLDFGALLSTSRWLKFISIIISKNAAKVIIRTGLVDHYLRTLIAHKHLRHLVGATTSFNRTQPTGTYYGLCHCRGGGHEWQVRRRKRPLIWMTDDTLNVKDKSLVTTCKSNVNDWLVGGICHGIILVLILICFENLLLPN